MTSVQISGAVVRELRQARGWTQEQLATLINATEKTVQRVENRGICALETRSALLAVFQIELKQLEGEQRIQQAKSAGEGEVLFYHRVVTGSDLVSIFQDTFAYRFSYEDPRSSDDADTFAGAVQEIQDYSEIWDDIESGGRVRATFDLGDRIKQLESQGIWVFGLRTRGKWTAPHRDGTTGEVKGAVCNVHLAYADSEKVTILDPKASS